MLSRLQKYILRNLYTTKFMKPQALLRFYEREKNPPSRKDQQTTVVRSAERLIIQGLIAARGKWTKNKWYIEALALTPAGKKRAKSFFTQPQLPFIYSSHGHSKKH